MKTNHLLIALALLMWSGTAFAQLALIRQGHGESPGTAEAGDNFGAAVALGDFDGDGYDDLATGAPLERSEPSSFQSGFVAINYSSAYGIGWSRTDTLTLLDGSYPTTQEAFMGAALAVGDFNADGFDDLAVGLPGAVANGQARAGLVFVYYGSETGLPGVAQVLDQSHFGAAREANDSFGAALAAGRLGNDTRDSLAIGAPGENSSAGAVFIIRGSAGGLNVAQTQVIVGGDIGAPAQAGDELGGALAIGDIYGFSWPELAIGAPGTDAGIIENSGTVHVITGTNAGVNTGDVQHIDLASVGDFYGTNARFGHALVLGNFYPDGGGRDLAIGAPGRFTGGRVYIGRGTLVGLTWPTTLRQADNLGGDEANDNFGWALAAGDHDGDGADELAVGSPGEDVELFGQQDVGWLYVFKGSAAGLSQANVTGYSELDLGDQLGGAGMLGSSLAMGRTSRLNIKSIVVGAPQENASRGQVFDLAPWRQVIRPLCTSALSADCEDNVIYALKPFDQLYIASTTKIMTTLLACEAVDRPAADPLHVGLNEVYQIQPWMAQGFPLGAAQCSVFGFAPFSDSMTFENLFYACIMPSGNDASYAIADAMTEQVAAWNGYTNTVPQFTALMNQRAAQLGLTQTFFTNPAGRDEGDPYSTAYDMWKLGRAAMGNARFREVVGATDRPIAHLVEQGEAGIYAPGITNQSNGYLKALQGREPRSVGLKGGWSVPAGICGVAAGRASIAPYGLAYATGFGWARIVSPNGDESAVWLDKFTALLTLALEECDPDFHGSDLPVGPLTQGTWPVGNTERDDARVTTFASNGAVDGTSTQPGHELTLLLYPAPGSSVPVPPPVRWTYRAVWVLPGGRITGIAVDPISGYSGSLRNVSDTPGTAVLVLRRSHPSGGPITVPLAQNQLYTIPPWMAAAGQSAALELTIENAGTQPVELAFEGQLDFKPVFTANPAFLAHLTPLMPPGRENSVLAHREAPGTGSGLLRYVLTSPAAGFRFFPPIKIDAFQLRRTTASDNVVLRWSTLPALGALYQDYQIQTTPTLSSPVWTNVATVPAQSSGQQTWQSAFPPAPQRFLRVLGNLAE